MKAGKIWGKTYQIVANEGLEFHRIEAKADTRCSMHMHRHKWNGFFVESGRLKIVVRKQSYDLEDETILEAGDYTEVPPGEYHCFEAIEDTVAFELYWAPKLDGNDIEREDVGGYLS
jgi:mannose-6-phosphate isomerase-like protein (cupin superfamily)